MKKERINVGIITILLLVIIGLTGYIIYDKVSYKKNNSNQEIKDENLTNEDVSEQNKDETIKCDECVTEIIDITKDESILLGNKIRKVKFIDDIIYIDNQQTVKVAPNELTYLKGIYVIDNEIVMIATSGSDIRNNKYYFYNSNLEKINVNMTLDNEYPNSMLEAPLLDNTISIENNKIIIIGSRTTHNKDLVLESKDVVTLCNYNYRDAKLIKGTYEKYKNELVKAKYEMEYLGNGKFSEFKRVEVLETVDENYCN